MSFEKYEVTEHADPTLSKCSFFAAGCSTCKVTKQDSNSWTYRPVNASSTVLCAAGSSVDEYRSIDSFVRGAHTFRVFSANIVNGLPVRDGVNLSDPSCISWVE